jgi:hypothetical protein
MKPPTIFGGKIKNIGANRFFQAHMGKNLQPLREIDYVAYRTFENGIIILN